VIIISQVDKEFEKKSRYMILFGVGEVAERDTPVYLQH
jgi:hypothetical protein